MSKDEATGLPIGAQVSPSKNHDDALSTITKRGPHGDPVYDGMGFEIDYEKAIAGIRRRPGCKTKSVNGYQKMVRNILREDCRKAEIMGSERDQVSAVTLRAWTDLVSRDLWIPYHTVEHGGLRGVGKTRIQG